MDRGGGREDMVHFRWFPVRKKKKRKKKRNFQEFAGKFL